MRTVRGFVRICLLVAVAACAVGCESATKKNSKPAGTPTDPVEVCERLADVCRFKSSQLGVCVQADQSATRLVCAPQH